jgi:hypothetical protein
MYAVPSNSPASPASDPYNFWYSSLPSSFFASTILRTALLKSSWLMASRSALMANKPL